MNVNGVHFRSVQFSSWIWLIFLVNWYDREWTWLIYLVNWKLSSHKEGIIWLKYSITISFSPKNFFFHSIYSNAVLFLPTFSQKSLPFHFLFLFISLKIFAMNWSWVIVAHIFITKKFMIVSDCGSNFKQMIVSDRGSWKIWTFPSLVISMSDSSTS